MIHYLKKWIQPAFYRQNKIERYTHVTSLSLSLFLVLGCFCSTVYLGSLVPIGLVFSIWFRKSRVVQKMMIEASQGVIRMNIEELGGMSSLKRYLITKTATLPRIFQG